ncbi:MAG: hypothetical protein QG670_2154 [Thermoproteota archaeon]|nr:hypothetical protein [Thermoproteota archaeon]
MKERVNVAIYKLEATANKLKQLSTGLMKKDEKFFSKCIEAQIAKNHMKAVIYANECAELRKMARLTISSELALEQAVLRLQTVGEISDVMVTVEPIVSIVQETKGRLVGVIPSVAGNLDEINSMLHTSITEMGSAYSPKIEGQSSNGEAIKILEEANLAAEEKIREKFPELPSDLTNQELEETNVPVALTATGGEVPEMNDSTLGQQVFEYIKECDGELSIIQCASYLGVFPKDIEKAILRLKEEGKIALD